MPSTWATSDGPWNFDQLHHVDPARLNDNPNYLKVNLYQAAFSVRAGMPWEF